LIPNGENETVDNMSNVAVFLGAGASKALGLPITSDIFPMLLNRLVGEPTDGEPLFGGDPIDRDRLKRCLYAILPGLDEVVASAKERDSWVNSLPLITDVLSAVDFFLLSASAPIPGLPLSELAQARTLLERAIFELLVRNETPDAISMAGMPEMVFLEWQRTAKRTVLPTRSVDYEVERDRIVNWLFKLRSESRDRVTLISTNYDIEIEQELYSKFGYSGVFHRLDFGTSVRDPSTGEVHHRPNDAEFGVYKLHGSLNWLRCNVCDNIYINPVGAIAYISFLLGDDAERRKPVDPSLELLETGGANRCHCGYRPLRHVIVAPSFVRSVRDAILLEIWRNAQEALRQADKWIIVGYSLPPEDVAIRSMLLRAYQGRDTKGPPEVEVVQKEEKDPEYTRYRLLFPKCRFLGGGLASYLSPKGNGVGQGA
jgi:hypothetical protein